MSCVLQLSINAFDYNCHVDLIKLLKQEGELFSLRKARQRMSELFPLTEGWCMCNEVVDDATWKYFPSKSPFLSCSAEIWLDWLKDEIHLSEEEPNREKLYELFERAVKDYICECLFHGHQIGFVYGPCVFVTILCVFIISGPDIWLEYAQYSIGGMGLPGGIDKVRSIFERAVTAVGLHMTKGQMVWEAYREFENAIFSTLQVCFSSVLHVLVYVCVSESQFLKRGKIYTLHLVKSKL